METGRLAFGAAGWRLPFGRYNVPAVRGCRLGSLFAVVLLVAGCHRAPRPRPNVVTSIFPVYDLTRRIAGPDADVTMVLPVGASPHIFTPPPARAAEATGMTFAILIGLDLDPWMDSLIARAAKKPRVLRLADRVPTLPLQSAPASIDPHVWLDPQRALLMGRAISDELCRADPAHAAGYRARSLELTHALEGLDHELEERTKTWPAKAFVTLHDDLGYYAARYHLEVGGVVETTPGVAPTAERAAELLAHIQERHATVIFGEPQLDSTPAQQMSRAQHLAYGVLDPLGGSVGVDSYEALLRADTLALERALTHPSGPAATPENGPPP